MREYTTREKIEKLYEMSINSSSLTLINPQT